MIDPLDIARELKEEADRILIESNIIHILEEYGDVRMIGSYTLDVMFRPDIDILVFGLSHDFQKATHIAHQLIDLDYFNEVRFVDKVKNLGEKARGYYLQPHKTLNERDWKFDIWLTVGEVFDNRNEVLKRRLSEADNISAVRSTIVQLKEHFRSGEKYRNSIDGNKIYNTVLDHQDASMEELIHLLEAK